MSLIISDSESQSLRDFPQANTARLIRFELRVPDPKSSSLDHTHSFTPMAEGSEAMWAEDTAGRQRKEPKRVIYKIPQASVPVTQELDSGFSPGGSRWDSRLNLQAWLRGQRRLACLARSAPESWGLLKCCAPGAPGAHRPRPSPGPDQMQKAHACASGPLTPDAPSRSRLGACLGFMDEAVGPLAFTRPRVLIVKD